MGQVSLAQCASLDVAITGSGHNDILDSKTSAVPLGLGTTKPSLTRAHQKPMSDVMETTRMASFTVSGLLQETKGALQPILTQCSAY